MNISPAQIRDLAIALLVVVLVGYGYLTTRPVDHPAGVLVAQEPEQKDPVDFAPISKGAFTLQPRARFAARTRVLARERYYLGALADVVPLDLAMGWGRMSDSAVLARLKISQSNRFYFWQYDDDPPIPREEIETHSANWHLLAANDAVSSSLRRIRVGDVVQLTGLLVDIENPDMETMRTSLTRNDTGAGACEVFYVKSVVIADD